VEKGSGRAAADVAAGRGGATLTARLGLQPGQVVQEFGYDSDVDDDLRMAIEDAIDGELADEGSFDDVADVGLLWWRDDDGDLVDALVDVLTNLADRGAVLLLCPKSGREGHVQASEIEEAALTAGLHATSTVSAGADWIATRLVAPKGGRR
jgi:Protein of unknown function (DUF3052)